MQQNAAKRRRLVVLFETPDDIYLAVRGSGPDAASNDNAPRHDSPVAHPGTQLLTCR
jgi:hypothetical protein